MPILLDEVRGKIQANESHPFQKRVIRFSLFEGVCYLAISIMTNTIAKRAIIKIIPRTIAIITFWVVENSTV